MEERPWLIPPPPSPARRPDWLRILLWAILILFALFYLAPLYVMIATSLKSVEEIRAGNLLAFRRT